jgi:hypothetical protein
MKAHTGDRIVIVSTKLDGHVRQGHIVQVRNDDGSPPYLVEWDDDGQQALMFPGTDARLVPGDQGDDVVSGEQRPAGARHVRSWQIRVDLFESDEETTAHAVLVTEAPTHLDAHGVARRRPGDTPVPEIGDEVAAARALRQLADQLLGTAADDISAIEGHQVTLPS